MLAMPGRMQPHSQAGARDEDILDAKQQGHETQSVCFCAYGNYTHKCGLCHLAYGSTLAKSELLT